MIRHASPMESAAVAAGGRAAGAAEPALRGALGAATAALLLALAAPPLLLSAAALRAERGGPVLARHRAVGAGGREFDLLRLRCFRATPLGRLLRATGLAGLPALLNVLRGEMSLIGPAPMAPEELAALGRAPAAVAVRPGMVSW
jgi:lipopolysaccharide/colanic/teichoic acid biosynthesis glycosyltransferase